MKPIQVSSSLTGYFHLHGLMSNMFSNESNKLETYMHVRMKKIVLENTNLLVDIFIYIYICITTYCY